MLAITDLHVRYGAVRAVQGATLRVGAGELVGLIGPNGAGKSSLLKAVAGLLRPAGGSVLFEGAPIGPNPIAVGIAYVPENRRIFTSMTVRENLRLGATSRPRREILADLEAIYERFPLLSERRNTGADQLSGGQQQILAIARAVIGRPRLILLDEPSLGLSPAMIDEVFTLSLSLRESGTAVLLVEQNTLRTLEIADRVYVMRPPGEIVLEGSKEDIERDPSVKQHYVNLL